MLHPKARGVPIATLLCASLGGCQGARDNPGRQSSAITVTATPAQLSGVIRLQAAVVPDEVQVDARDVAGNYTATTRPGGAKQDGSDPLCAPGSQYWCYKLQVESALASSYVLRPIAYLSKSSPYQYTRIPFLPSAQVDLQGAGNPVTAPLIDFTPATVTGTFSVTGLQSQPLPLRSHYMSFHDLSNTYVESCGGSANFCPFNSVDQGASATYTAYLKPGEDYNYLSQAFTLDEGPLAQTEVQFDYGLHLGALAPGQVLTANRPFGQVAQVSGSAQLPVPVYNLLMTVGGVTTTIDPVTHNPMPFSVGYRTLNYVGPGSVPLADTSYIGRVFSNADLSKPVTLAPQFTLSADGQSNLLFPPVPLDFSGGSQITRDFTGEYATISGHVTLSPPYPIKNGVYPQVEAVETDVGGYGYASTGYVTDPTGGSFVLPAFGTPTYTGNWSLWRFGWDLDLGDPNFTSNYVTNQYVNIPVQVASGGNATPPAFTFATALVKVYFTAPAQPAGTTLSDPRLGATSADGEVANAAGLNQDGLQTAEARMVLRAHNGQNGPVAFHLTPSAVINAGGVPGTGRTDFGPVTLFPSGGDVTVIGVPGPIALTVTAPQEGQVFPICSIPVTGLSTGQPGIGITVNGQAVPAPSTNNPGDPQQVGFSATLTPPPGPLTIQVTADDGNGHAVSDVRHVSCLHPQNHAPTVTCPSAQTLACASAAGAPSTLQVAIADSDNDPLQVVWTVDGTVVQTSSAPAGAASDSYGGTFPAYGHAVVVTVSDGYGGSASCTTSVNVQNPFVTTAVQRGQLDNPDHTLVNVGWSFQTNDRCAKVATRDVKVYSNEADVVAGSDGLYSPDAKTVNIPGTQITTQVRLRSERAAAGRVYLIVHTVTDVNGHAGWDCSSVTVPLDGAPASVAAVSAAAQAAVASCKASGGAPAGYVQVGTGPALGPYQ